MASDTTMSAELPATEFSPTELASLRERREALGANWVKVVRAEQSNTEADGLSVDAQEQIERIQREYGVLSATIKEHEKAKAQSELVKAEEDLTSNAPNYRDLQAKKEAQFFKDLMAAGQGRYTNPNPTADPKGGSHPGTLEISQPLIAQGADGKNKVFPFSAIFNKGAVGEQADANIEASFRNAEIIASDKFRQYDPATGNKVSAHLAPVGKQLEAVLGFDSAGSGVDDTVADVYLRQGGMLYQYEIDRNELAQYMNIRQVPYVNDLLIDRRTAIGSPSYTGTAATTPGGAGSQLIREGDQIGVIDSSFDTITVTPKKFAHIRGMSYESSQLMEPWSVAQTIMTDAGIFMGNMFGEQIVEGNSLTPGGAMNTQFNGLGTWGVRNTAYQHNLATVANFTSPLDTAAKFGISAMTDFMTSLPKQYFRAPSKLVSMKLSTWGKLMGAVDGERRKLFDSNSSLEDMALPDFNIRVVLDENWGDGSANTANNIVRLPMFYGDFSSATYVLYGPVRVDYSSEFGFTTDRYYWRFIAHRGFAIVDPNGMRAGVVT